MQRLIYLTALLLSFGASTIALGHGHPINVSVSSNQLIVSSSPVNGTADGFANQIFVETDSAGDPQDFATFTNFGPAVYWTVPGFSISGLAENSGLYLQTIARPVRGTNPVESRVFWYWDPSSPLEDKVELAPDSSRMQLRQTATISTLLTPTTTTAPPALELAALLAADMHPDNHDLLRYLMPSPLPPSGAYGFFARFTSDVYAPSNPFLVVINNGELDATQMLDAAAAINRDALLAGDFNHDDKVSAADYVLWRNTLNSTMLLAADGSSNGVIDDADRDIWRNNFGLSFPPIGSGLGAGANVPEPTTLTIAILSSALTVVVAGRGKRRR